MRCLSLKKRTSSSSKFVASWKPFLEKTTPTIPNFNFVFEQLQIQNSSTRKFFSAKPKKYVGTKMGLFLVFIGTKMVLFFKITLPAKHQALPGLATKVQARFPYALFSQKCAYREKKWIMFWRKNKTVFQKFVHVELLHLLLFF